MGAMLDTPSSPMYTDEPERLSTPAHVPFTLASIGTVLLDIFEPPSPTPDELSLAALHIASQPPSPSLASSASSVPESFVTTPTRYSFDAFPTSPLRTAYPPRALSLDSPARPRERPATVLGGGGLYALIGARVWLASNEMRAVVDRDDADDLPGLEAEIDRFGPEMWVFNSTPGASFPRSRIGFDGDVRTYEPIVRPAMRTGEELAALAQGPLGGAAFLHVAPPYGSADLLQMLAQVQATGSTWRPKIAFEPVPSSCHPGEKDNFERAAQHVDILSPNHEELLAFYGITASETSCGVRAAVEQAVEHLLHTVGVGNDGNGIVLIRCGPHGACVGTRLGGLRWTPSYWAHDSFRVRDVTGAGNAFIGGYIAGLKLTGGNPYEAALYASVSASFVVEQYGLPSLTSPFPSPNHSPEQRPYDRPANLYDLSSSEQNAQRALRLSVAKGREMWNTDSPQRRLELLRARAAVAA